MLEQEGVEAGCGHAPLGRGIFTLRPPAPQINGLQAALTVGELCAKDEEELATTTKQVPGEVSAVYLTAVV